MCRYLFLLILISLPTLVFAGNPTLSELLGRASQVVTDNHDASYDVILSKGQDRFKYEAEVIQVFQDVRTYISENNLVSRQVDQLVNFYFTEARRIKEPTTLWEVKGQSGQDVAIPMAVASAVPIIKKEIINTIQSLIRKDPFTIDKLAAKARSMTLRSSIRSLRSFITEAVPLIDAVMITTLTPDNTDLMTMELVARHMSPETKQTLLDAANSVGEIYADYNYSKAYREAARKMIRMQSLRHYCRDRF